MQARKLKDLEKENLQLKKLVANLSLGKAMLKEVLLKSHKLGQAQRSGRPGDGSSASLKTTPLLGDRTAESNLMLSEKSWCRGRCLSGTNSVVSKPILTEDPFYGAFIIHGR